MAYKCLASVALATMLIAGSASAATILVDFETTPGADGKLGTVDDLEMSNEDIRWIRDDLSAAGITFTQGTLHVSSFFDGNPANHFLSSTSPVASFSIPVYGISIESYSYWNATLYAYDASGAVLASSRVLNSSGDFQRNMLSLTTSQVIAGFAVLPDNSNYILNLDNLVLTTTAPVPEPSTYAMLASGLGLLASRARRRRI
jgi:hypothetical protein